jgi:muramoyltetrapeptide carboxypeptidase LdcA involved in peptidoglycan recycling
VTGGLGVPVVMGYAYGHEARKRSLPWGLMARLDATPGGCLALLD